MPAVPGTGGRPGCRSSAVCFLRCIVISWMSEVRLGRVARLVSQLMSSALVGSSITSGRGVHHTRRPTQNSPNAARPEAVVTDAGSEQGDTGARSGGPGASEARGFPGWPMLAGWRG